MICDWKPYGVKTTTYQGVRCRRCRRETRRPVGWWWGPAKHPSRRHQFERECPRCHGEDTPAVPALMPMIRQICQHQPCRRVFRSAKPTPFCSLRCAQAERRENADFRKKIRQDRTLESETFVGGLVDRPTRCPHPGCGAPLAYEPGFAHCAVGCGRLWPLRGASVAAQRTYELASGLSQA